MATLLEYLDEEPLCLSDVMTHCRVDADDDRSYLEDVVIPSARAMAESRSGAAIRMAHYQEVLVAGTRLSIGNVVAVDSAEVDGSPVLFTVEEKLRRVAVCSEAARGRFMMVKFRAGIEDLSSFPTVRSWLLLACGSLYRERELGGEETAERMKNFDTLLQPIMLPNTF